MTLFVYISTKYIEIFVILLDKLQKALQEELRGLQMEEVFDGLFDFRVVSNANSGEILQRQKKNESLLVRDQDSIVEGVGTPNQELG
ncbi:hypothetical protein TNCV_1446811 [Trichonephila clavipes]|nr:hypothetical protein TNCV_1446811 [Trichonephila clavipes]